MILNTSNVNYKKQTYFSTSVVGDQIQSSFRETDICGLLKEGTLIAVILTEVQADKIGTVKHVVAGKIREKLKMVLKDDVARQITISFRIYPETGGSGGAFDMAFYPEIRSKTVGNSGGQVVKRVLDIVGSAVGLLLFLPLFVFVPIIIKSTSEGPVFFSQDRIGLNGRKFKLLKFRTMFVNNDDVIHRDFVRKLIDGDLNPDTTNAVYKITGDPRVTRIGKILRKYSLDEVPQFLNVLKGDMSLVGPRPPINYEVEHYSSWQRNRLIGRKPGITGAWQVSGRSRTSFDEMVRLDLRYLKGWSIRGDIKIMLRTPAAVLKCRGAY